MQRVKRFLYYLLINALVSACTTFAVLLVWQARQPDPRQVVVTGPAPRVVMTGSVAIALETVVVTRVVTAPPDAWTPYPTRGVVTYRVKEGDTLSTIADYFAVSLEALMELNNLKNPDRLVSNVDLLIPPPSTFTPTPTPVPTATPAPTRARTASPTPQFSPSPTGPAVEPLPAIAAVIGVGDLTTERVVLRMPAGQAVLTGWQLKDENGNTFTFPQLTLLAGGQVNVYTRSGQPSVTTLYWGLTQPVWQAGETVSLLDAQGRVISTYTIP